MGGGVGKVGTCVVVPVSPLRTLCTELAPPFFNAKRSRLSSPSRGDVNVGWEQEVQRSHRCVLNPGGVLRIRPLQALHLKETTKPIYVTVRYPQRKAEAHAYAEAYACSRAP